MVNARLQAWGLGVLIVGVLILSFFVFQPYLAAAMLALVFVVACLPIHRFILNLVRYRFLAALASTLTVLILILLPISIFGVLLFQEAQEVSVYVEQQDPDWADRVWSQAALFVEEQVPLISLDMLIEQTEPREVLQVAVQTLLGYFENIVTGVIRVGIGFFVMVLAMFYLFRDGRQFMESIKNLTPLKRSHTSLIVKKMEQAINAVVRGRLLVGVIQGFVVGTGLVIFGVPNPVLWGAVAAVTSMLPIVGPMFVVIPAILFLFSSGSTIAALGLLLWGLAAVLIVDEYLGSILVDQRMQIHPFLVLVSVLGGITFFGPIGFVLGPVVLSLLFALLEIYANIIVPRTAKAK